MSFALDFGQISNTRYYIYWNTIVTFSNEEEWSHLDIDFTSVPSGIPLQQTSRNPLVWTKVRDWIHVGVTSTTYMSHSGVLFVQVYYEILDLTKKNSKEFYQTLLKINVQGRPKFLELSWNINWLYL